MHKIYHSNIKLNGTSLWVASCNEAVVSIGINEKKEEFLSELSKSFSKYSLVEDCIANEEAITQLTEYFNGGRREFTLRIKLNGTDFQKKVWRELINIPYGQTTTYKDIAIKINKEKAYRAVGLANNRNKLAIVVPCHRVIGSDNSLVGYAGGLHIKRQLLKLEGIRCIDNKVLI